MSTTTTTLAPVLSLTHGGGPLPLLNDPDHAFLIKSLTTKVPPILQIGTANQPKAILLITAHWETPEVTISNASKPSLYYDYGGFPSETYTLKYDAPGSPEVAEKVASALKQAGIKSVMDPNRGWDHGVFVPLLLVHPAATIPVVQMSVLRSQSAKDLYAIGRALSPLRAQGIAIVGSGSASFHNLRAMFSGESGSGGFQKLQRRWSQRLREAVEQEDGDARGRALEGWKSWEGSAKMHPEGRTEHFSPLVVACGAAGEGKAKGWEDRLMGVEMRTFYWE